MPQHENKPCPRCGQLFECKVGDVSNCHCSSITLTVEERAFIEEKYTDCLCQTCLLLIKNKQVLFAEKYFPKQ